MTLSNEDRKKRSEFEGFGTEFDGTGEKIITPDQRYEVKESSSYEKCTIDNVGKKIEKDKRKSKGVLFKVPFMSRYFGQRIEEKNWRLIPMRNMKITIKITTNPFAFFRPFSQSYVVEETIVPAKPIDKIKIVEPKFCFTEYTFSQSFDSTLYVSP